MPLSLTGHHALIDGKNMGDFFNTFQEQIEL
jgi:chloramphenicol O-acetyltransferase